MAADPSRQRVLLGGLVALLAVVVWWQFGPVGAGPGAAVPTGGGAQPARPAPTSPAETLAAGVALDRLGRIPAVPIDSGRDPFVLGAGRGTGPGGRTVGADGGASSASVPSVPVAPMPTGPPSPPAITVKFIGVVQRSDVGTVAVLSDGRNVYYGREGEIVDGRWRIVRIGEESLQIEHADGSGRQTVRLTG